MTRSDERTNATARSGAALLLHGLGHDPEIVMAQFGETLSYGCQIAAPQAPYPGPEAVGGFAWFSVDFTAEEPVARLDQEAASRAGMLAEARRLCALSGEAPVELYGFGQGGAVALGLMLDSPHLFSACTIAGGRLIDAVADRFPPTDAHRGKRLFWGHGCADPAISFDMARAGRERLRGYGMDLAVFDHDGGHAVPLEMLVAIRAWFEGDRR